MGNLITSRQHFQSQSKFDKASGPSHNMPHAYLRISSAQRVKYPSGRKMFRKEIVDSK